MTTVITTMETSKHIAGASAEYRARRDCLLAAEIALKDQREQVAELRRSLPMGPAVTVDYVFREGPADLADNDESHFWETRFVDLFAPGKDSLLVDHLMFGANDERPCPMCSMWADGYDAVVRHVMQRANFVLIAKADLGKLRTWAQRKGWTHVRLLSARGNSFNEDFLVEQAGSQQPAVSVFKRLPDGNIHHFYTTEASLASGHHRGIDIFTPVWNLFDLLPEGRGNWMPKHDYA
jgi:predicted dithiol-disulfide oxidoreductase (DUF899 family)